MLIRRGYTDRQSFDFNGVHVRTMWSPRVWGVDTLIHTFVSLVYARVVLRPKIIHLHGIGPGFFAPLARALAFVTVVTHHAQDYRRPKWGRKGRLFLRWGELFTAGTANAVVCVSKALQGEFLKAYPWAARRTLVIRNAGALPDAGRPNQSKVLETHGLKPQGYILAVGRLDATKAFDELIEAFSQLRKRGRKKLVIAGSDAGNDEHAAMLRGLVSEDILFVGYQSGDDLRRLYEQAALFVHPSHMEGYGLVVAEALSAGAPVIASDIPPHREFALREPCYFPAGDVDALARLLAVRDYSAYLSPEAIANERSDSWDRVAGDHLDLFRKLVGTARLHDRGPAGRRQGYDRSDEAATASKSAQ